MKTIITVKMDGTKTVKEMQVNISTKKVMELLKEYPCIAYVERPNGAGDLVNVSAYNNAEVEKITELVMKANEKRYYYMVVRQNNAWDEKCWDGKKWVSNDGKLYKTLKGACDVIGITPEQAYKFDSFKCKSYGQAYIIRVAK